MMQQQMQNATACAAKGRLQGNLGTRFRNLMPIASLNKSMQAENWVIPLLRQDMWGSSASYACHFGFHEVWASLTRGMDVKLSVVCL